jgi:hypothetical protein
VALLEALRIKEVTIAAIPGVRLRANLVCGKNRHRSIAQEKKSVREHKLAIRMEVANASAKIGELPIVIK